MTPLSSRKSAPKGPSGPKTWCGNSTRCQGFAGRSIKSAPCVAKSSKYRCVQEGDNVVQLLSQPDAASKSATETTKAGSGTAHFSPGDRVRLRAGISSPRHGMPPGGRSSVGVITHNMSNQDIRIDFDDGTRGWNAWSPDFEPVDPGTVVLPGEVVGGSIIIGSAGHEYLQVENCRGVPLGFLPMSDASGTQLFAPLDDESGGGAGRGVRDEIVAIFKAKDLSKVESGGPASDKIRWQGNSAAEEGAAKVRRRFGRSNGPGRRVVRRARKRCVRCVTCCTSIRSNHAHGTSSRSLRSFGLAGGVPIW